MVSTTINTFGVFVVQSLPLIYVLMGVAMVLFIFRNFSGTIIRGIRRLL